MADKTVSEAERQESLPLAGEIESGAGDPVLPEDDEGVEE